MQLSHIEVNNYTRLADLSFDIRGHAVIVGANDVGKTSLLRLLNLLLGSTAAQMYQGLALGDLRDPSRPLVVEATFTSLTTEEFTLLPDAITVDPWDDSLTLRVRLEARIDLDDTESLSIRRWFPDAGHDRSPTREQLLAFGWRYLPANRSASATQLDGPNSALQAMLGTVNLGSERAALTHLLESFNSTLHASSVLERLRVSMASHLSRAMPTSVTKEDIALRTAADPADSVLENVSMFLRRGQEHISITEQSDGLRQLMLMTLFDLAEGSAHVIAIDEPELHLHPSSQRTVAELFQAARNQKVLATHSPYIVQRFDPAQVIAVTPNSICHQIPSEKLGGVHKIQANWWSPRLLEALTARYVIAVEGLSDRIIVEGAARAMGINLDRLGVVVFDIDGADSFGSVYKLLGPEGFGVSLLGIVDDAQKESWIGCFPGKRRAILGKKVWVSAPDLEGEYSQSLGGPRVAELLIAGGYCKESDILASCGVAKVTEVPNDAAARFCRRGKVSAAVALAGCLDAESARSIGSIAGALNEVAIRDGGQ